MIKDFFDEDFPLTQKQEDELKKQQAAVANAEVIPEPMPEQTASENNTAEDFFADDDKTVIFTAEDSDVPEQIEFDPIDHAPIIDVDGDGINDKTYPDMFDANAKEVSDSETNDICEATEEAIPETVPEVVSETLTNEEPIAETITDNTVTDSEEEIEIDDDDDLDAELEALHARLASIEKTVDAINAESDDYECDDSEPTESFSYSYDERYFAEDETPAYKHPEIVKAKRTVKTDSKKASKDDVTINIKTLAKVGAAVAGAVVALKLLSNDSKK